MTHKQKSRVSEPKTKFPVLEQEMGPKWAKKKVPKYDIFKQIMIKVSGSGKKMLPGA